MNKPVTKLEPEAEVGSPLDPLAILRRPFLPHQISKLPKPFKKDAPKGKCAECGGYHGLPAVHLDYVGHAALTDRLLEADPHWAWEPVADPMSQGLPTAPGGMWIKLTVAGVSRYGFGHPDGKTGGDAVKETIGDALRNAAMRFGAALDLWHKGDLHLDEAEERPAQQQSATKTTGGKAPETPTLAQRADRVEAAIRGAESEEAARKAYGLASRVCAELSTNDPARLEQVEKTYAEALAKFAPPPAEDAFGIGDSEVPF